MANELTVVELYGQNNDGNPRRYTIADGTAVSKGTTLALSDPRTVTVSTGASVTCGGVAAEEHKPNIGVTSISAWTDGVFEAVASGAIEAGAGINFVDGNRARSGAISVYGYSGYTLETATDGETINVRVQL